MPGPSGNKYASAIALSSEEQLHASIGPTYDGAKMLNVIKMMVGLEDMYPATIVLSRAFSQPKGSTREYGKFSCYESLK